MSAAQGGQETPAHNVVLRVSSGWAVLRGVCVRAGVPVTLRAAAASVPADGRVQPVNWSVQRIASAQTVRTDVSV